MFGQPLGPVNITANTFAEISEFEMFFKDSTVHINEDKHCFEVNIFGAPKHKNHEICEITNPKTDSSTAVNIMLDEEIIACFRRLSHNNN